MIEDLQQLPYNHTLRNTPLITIGAFYLPRDAKVWREVFPAFGIAKNTFNELGDVWTRWDVWKATKILNGNNREDSADN